MTATPTPTEVTAAPFTRHLRIAAPPAAVLEAITTAQGVSAWWAPATATATGLRLEFGREEPLVLTVTVADPPTRVEWPVVSCFLHDWPGTCPTFELAPTDDGGTDLTFRHEGLTAALDCFDECSAGWGRHLPSLRSLLETGRGAPVVLR